MNNDVPVQSLIDHIKTAIDVDPWAKEMAEELLKKQEQTFVEIDGQFGGIKYGRCPKCGKGLNEEVYPHWCGFCGQAVKWE